MQQNPIRCYLQKDVKYRNTGKLIVNECKKDIPSKQGDSGNDTTYTRR